MYKNIGNSEFVSLMNAPDVVVMDVRTPQEYKQGFITGATVFIDINNEPFASKIQNLDKTKTYLVYCRSGARSGHACSIMEANGFTGPLYNLARGIINWDGEVKK